MTPPGAGRGLSAERASVHIMLLGREQTCLLRGDDLYFDLELFACEPGNDQQG